VRQEVLREAGAVVTNLDAQVRAVFPGREDDGRPGGREARGVGEEVVGGLADPVGVNAGLDPGRDVDVAGDPGRGQAGPGQGRAAAEERGQVRIRELQVEPASVAARQYRRSSVIRV
jgi:hypothetical protein